LRDVAFQFAAGFSVVRRLKLLLPDILKVLLP
jgi:hypothetical protein